MSIQEFTDQAGWPSEDTYFSSPCPLFDEALTDQYAIAETAGDAPPTPAPTLESERQLVQQFYGDLTGFLRSDNDVLPMQFIAEQAASMPNNERSRVIELCLAALTGNAADGQPRFTIAQQNEYRQLLTGNPPTIPFQVLIYSDEALNLIFTHLRNSLAAESTQVQNALDGDGDSLGPLGTSLYNAVIGTLRRALPALLGNWFARSPDFPPPGCPLRLPPDVTWTQLRDALRPGASEQQRALVQRVIDNSPGLGLLQGALHLNTVAGLDLVLTGLEMVRQSREWQRTTTTELANLIVHGWRIDTQNNLALLYRAGYRFGDAWLPTENTNADMYYAAIAHRSELVQRAHHLVAVIHGLRQLNSPDRGPYPPGGDPFRPEIFPGHVHSGRALINLPTSLAPSLATDDLDRRLEEWIQRYSFVQRDFDALLDQATRDHGVLMFGNIPERGVMIDRPYNLVCHRFNVTRENGQIIVRPRIEYYNSPWYNPHDAFGSPVHTETLAPVTLQPDDLVLVASNNGPLLVRARNLAVHSSNDWSRASIIHNGDVALGVTFDAAMLLSAAGSLYRGARFGAIAAGTADATLAMEARAAAALAMRRAIWSALLGGTTLLTSSDYANRPNTFLDHVISHGPTLRHALFSIDLLRNQVPGVVQSIANRARSATRSAALYWRLPWVPAAVDVAPELALDASLWQRAHTASVTRWADAAIGVYDRTIHVGLWGPELYMLGDLTRGMTRGVNPYGATSLINYADRLNNAAVNLSFLREAAAGLSGGVRSEALARILTFVNQHQQSEYANNLNGLRFIMFTREEQGPTRIMAALSIVVLLMQQRATSGQPLNENRQSLLNEASRVLAEFATNTNTPPEQRMICAQGMLLAGTASPQSYANLCRSIATDTRVPENIRLQAVSGVSYCLMMARQVEAGLTDPTARMIYLSRSFNTRAEDLEDWLLEMAHGQHGATNNMRVFAVGAMHALNRDNQEQATTMLSNLTQWLQNNPQGNFPQYVAASLLRDLSAGTTDLGETALNRVQAGRLAAATALSMLLLGGNSDLANAIRKGFNVEQVNRLLPGLNAGAAQAIVTELGRLDATTLQTHVYEIAYSSSMELSVQAVMQLGPLDRLSVEQREQLCTRINELLVRQPPAMPDQVQYDCRAMEIARMQAALLQYLPNIFRHFNHDQRARLMTNIGSLLNSNNSAAVDGNGQFVEHASMLRQQALATLQALQPQHALPQAIWTYVENLAAYTNGTPNERNAAVREAALRLLMAYPIAAHAALATNERVDPVLEIAQAWQQGEPDIRLRMLADEIVRVQAQRAWPSLDAISACTNFNNGQRPRLTTPETFSDEYIQSCLRRFDLLDVPSDGPTLQAEITAQVDTRYGGWLGRLQIFADLSEGRQAFEERVNQLARQAVAHYVSRFNQLMVLAQSSGVDANMARQACAWIVQTNARDFPEGIRQEVTLMAATALTRMIDGPHSAEALHRIEALFEDPRTPPLARLIFLNGLRGMRDTFAGFDDARYCQLLENVFAELSVSRPAEGTTAAEDHYRLLAEIMHDLAVNCQLRSPLFLGRLAAMCNDTHLPQEVRQFAMRCQGMLFGWTVIEHHRLEQANTQNSGQPNPTGQTPEARVAYLMGVPREPFSTARVTAILQSGQGMPFVSNDARLPYYITILNSPDPELLREQFAVCRVLLEQVPDRNDQNAVRQWQLAFRQVMLFLARVSEFGVTGAPTINPRIPYLQLEAREILDQFVLRQPPEHRQQMRASIDTFIQAARQIQEGVIGLFDEVDILMASPLGSRLQLSPDVRLAVLQDINTSNGTRYGADTARMLLFALTERSANVSRVWTPSSPSGQDTQMQIDARNELVTSLLNSVNMNPRVRLACVMVVLSNRHAFPIAVVNRALAALTALADAQLPEVPLWQREARDLRTQIQQQH